MNALKMYKGYCDSRNFCGKFKGEKAIFRAKAERNIKALMPYVADQVNAALDKDPSKHKVTA